MQDYKKLRVWEKSHNLTLEIYSISKSFPKEETYGLTSQMRRSSVSIPANIAEGCGKYTASDTCRFFQIALGSTHEVEYYILLSRDLFYTSEDIYNKLNLSITEIKAMLISLIKKSKERVNSL